VTRQRGGREERREKGEGNTAPSHLARRVPDLELALPPVRQSGAVSQVGSADGDLGARVEAAADVAEHQAGLADALFAFFCVFFWGWWRLRREGRTESLTIGCVCARLQSSSSLFHALTESPRSTSLTRGINGVLGSAAAAPTPRMAFGPAGGGGAAGREVFFCWREHWTFGVRVRFLPCLCLILFSVLAPVLRGDGRSLPLLEQPPISLSRWFGLARREIDR